MSEKQHVQGGLINLSVHMSNHSTNVVEVADIDSPRKFEYVLTNIKRGRAIVLSQERAVINREGDKIPKLPETTQQLVPGDSLIYPDELSALSQVSIPAGQYTVSVSYRYAGKEGITRVESDSVSIDIQSYNIDTLAMFTSTQPYNYLSSVYLHRINDSQGAIFQRDSNPDAPADGRAFFRKQLSIDDFGGVAIAQEFGDRYDTRWLAWLEKDNLTTQYS
ncbi:MAG: hypothetical protein L3J28_12085 [Candidatus Polarisedimenticolaceae bacterium]|nr:hypothetical protein [Candidatus Polarisedimenticolaceae bacterium]